MVSLSPEDMTLITLCKFQPYGRVHSFVLPVAATCVLPKFILRRKKIVFENSVRHRIDLYNRFSTRFSKPLLACVYDETQRSAFASSSLNHQVLTIKQRNLGIHTYLRSAVLINVLIEYSLPSVCCSLIAKSCNTR